MSPPVSRQMARRLLTCEAATEKSSEPLELAAYRVCEKLRRPLCSLAGVAGFRSLLSSALRLARVEAPSLRTVRVAEDGSLEGLDALAPQKAKDDDAERAEILITHLLGLLITFIGVGVTSRMVQDAWPEVALDDRDSGEEKRA